MTKKNSKSNRTRCLRSIKITDEVKSVRIYKKKKEKWMKNKMTHNDNNKQVTQSSHRDRYYIIGTNRTYERMKEQTIVEI